MSLSNQIFLLAGETNRSSDHAESVFSTTKDPDFVDDRSSLELSSNDPNPGVVMYTFEEVTEPAVGYFEKLRFLWWSIAVMIIQLWSDFRHGHNAFTSLFRADLLSHFFFLPVCRTTPRLVLGGSYERLSVRVIPDRLMNHYEELDHIDRFHSQEMINCASSSYGGFARLEDNAEDLIKQTIATLPFAPSPPALEDLLSDECCQYMGFEACMMAPSGFRSNILAFRTIFNTARSQGRKCIFLCDRDSHNSMFTGAFQIKDAKIHKFNHNDLTDLELKLRVYKLRDPDAFVCVAVEGLYSMEGSTAPMPAILALKQVYGFKLLVDEAHSFMSLGSAGRGSFNYWQDLGYECSTQQADIMVCTFSKSIGCIGGMILANGEMSAYLNIERDKMRENGSERLSAPVVVRVLSILRKPILVRERMMELRLKATHAARVLSKAGCKVLSFEGSPVICFPVGTVRQLVRLHAECFRRGVALGGGGPPATAIWGCRVRMCIFATVSWSDLNDALKIIIQTCVRNQIPGISPMIDRTKHGQLDTVRVENSVIASKSSDEELSIMIVQLAAPGPRSSLTVGNHLKVCNSGLSALEKYGIGAGSARWMYGSYDVFITLEQQLARIYPSLIRHDGRRRAMVCGDAEITIASAFASRCAPPRHKVVDHLILVARSAPRLVQDAVNMAKTSPTRMLLHYDSISQIPQILSQARAGTARTYFMTVFVDTIEENGEAVDIIPLLRHISCLSAKELRGACIFFDDRKGLGKIGSKRLGYLNHMEDIHGEDFIIEALAGRAQSVDILVAGSFFDAFGHAGGYITGPAAIIEGLTWDARAYFFSTAPMPLQTVMSSTALRLLEKGVICDERW